MKSQVVKPFSVEEEYSKGIGINADDIDKLRQWLDTQPHLPKNLTDQDLILIYHRYERSIEVSKQEIDNQYTLRTLFTSFFKDRSWTKEIETVFQTTLFTILPHCSKAGDAIMYIRMVDTDTSQFNLPNTLKGMLMTLDLWQYEQGTWPGLMFIFDLFDHKISLVPKLDLHSFHQLGTYAPDSLLAKFKGVHFINPPSFMDYLSVVVKTFCPKEYQDLVFVHPMGSDTLKEFLDLDILPKEVGGKYKTLDECLEITLNKIRANEAYFKQEATKRVVESLRPGKPKTITDIFGSVEGSFKKLDID